GIRLHFVDDRLRRRVAVVPDDCQELLEGGRLFLVEQFEIVAPDVDWIGGGRELRCHDSGKRGGKRHEVGHVLRRVRIGGARGRRRAQRSHRRRGRGGGGAGEQRSPRVGDGDTGIARFDGRGALG